MTRQETITIALAGNPNCGKSTLFNAITGSRQKVGNYPGVTVEKKEGFARHEGAELHIVDLPGTYSLTAYSLDEVVARNFIIEQQPDVVIDILDAGRLESHLYLATQLLELSVPVVLALNKSDLAAADGCVVDAAKLSRLLGVPVVSTVALRRQGMEALLTKAVGAARNRDEALRTLRHPNYGPEVEEHVRQLAERVETRAGRHRRPRWYAVKLLEGDAQSIARLRVLGEESGSPQAGEALEEILDQSERLRRHIETVCGDPAEIILADRRYGYISGACAEAVSHPREAVEVRHAVSDRIDRVVTHRFLGLPIFAVAMYLVFQLTFLLGNPLVDLLDSLIHEHLAAAVASWWAPASDSLLKSLVVDGVLGGVGAVIVFIPLIVLLFLGVALLEDTGYMARAAFVMDRWMHRIGLHGKSFIPMLIGFGCSVPAVMATRTLESRRDRLTTILILPLMSCGARLPIYLLILPAFFANTVLIRLGWFDITLHAVLVFSLYGIGIGIAIGMAKLLRATLFRGETTPFVMELPPFRLPTLRGLGLHMWERTWMYIRKAGTIILAGSVILWAITTFPRKTGFSRDYDVEIAARENSEENNAERQVASDVEREVQKLRAAKRAEELEHTVAGRIGRGIEPVMKTMGFDGKIGTALIGAFAAKEIFVSQLGIVYSLGDQVDETSESLRTKLQQAYSPLVGFCICLFCLISLPCIATFAVTVRETGSWGWGLFQVGYLTAVAWGLTAAVYQIGVRLGG
jgi:ferrous iron transport protein B